MKRFFFSLIALTAAAVSCTQSALLETPTLDGTPVSFSPYAGRTPVTKATSIADEAGLNAEGGFFVYSFLNQPNKEKSLYLNANVKMTDGVWSYDNTVYWPVTEGSSLDFVAYSANGVNKGLVLDGTDGFTFTVQDDVNNQVDILATAYQAGKTATSEGVSGGDVTLKFFHLLSRVGFKVQTGSTQAFTIKSLSITGDTPTKGTLEFTDFTGDAVPALTPEEVVEDKEYFFVNSDAVMAGGASDATAITGMDSKYLMVMPHDAAGHTISITYTIGNSEIEKTATAELPAGFEFVQGKAYEFILKISTSALTFDVTEEEWNETGDTDLQPEPEEPEEEPEEDPMEETNEWGIVAHFVSFDYTTRYAVFDIVVTETGHNGLRMMLSTNGTTFNAATPVVFARGEEPTIGTHRVTITNGGTRLSNDNEKVYYYATTYDTSINSALKSYYSKDSGHEKVFTTMYTNSVEPTTPEGPTDEPLDPSEQPIVTIESLSVNQSAKSAVVTGSFIEGISAVTNYGFCWMTSAGTPTITNNHYECASSFSHTITGLSEGVNSCRAYVVTADGETYYSQVRTIEIEPATDEGDNTGGGNWEDDTEIEF